MRLRGCCWQLIDLDASCRIGVDYVCAKYSSAYIPPECIDSNSIYEPMHVSQNTVLAAVSFDIWSLGVILYQLCSTDAIPLFLSGQVLTFTHLLTHSPKHLLTHSLRMITYVLIGVTMITYMLYVNGARKPKSES